MDALWLFGVPPTRGVVRLTTARDHPRESTGRPRAWTPHGALPALPALPALRCPRGVLGRGRPVASYTCASSVTATAHATPSPRCPRGVHGLGRPHDKFCATLCHSLDWLPRKLFVFGRFKKGSHGNQDQLDGDGNVVLHAADLSSVGFPWLRYETPNEPSVTQAES